MEGYKKIFKEKTDIPQEIALKFGKILFGDFRNKGESDTDYEKKVFQNIKWWIQGEFMGKSPKGDVNKIFKELQKLKDIYPNVLKPTTSTLYRIVFTSSDPVKQNLEDFEKKGKRYYSKKKYTYTPENFAQSWTDSEGVAFGFKSKPVGIAKGTSNIHTKIVMKADFNSNDLLFNASFLNKVSTSEFGMRQNEIIHLGKNPIQVQYILDEENYKDVFSRAGSRGKFIKINDKFGVVFDSFADMAKVLTGDEEIIQIKNFTKDFFNNKFELVNKNNIPSKIMEFFKKYFKKHPELYFDPSKYQ